MSSTVTRTTLSLGMPMSFDPSCISIASSETVEKVPTCFFMPFSISSIFSPERRPDKAFQSPFFSWARSEHGIRTSRHAKAAFKHIQIPPISFVTLIG